MVDDSYAQLKPYLKDRAGEYLRGIAVYTSEDYTLRYIRDDLRTHRVESEIETMIDRLRQESLVREQRSFPFGGLQGIVRSFDEAMVMHFPKPRTRDCRDA